MKLRDYLDEIEYHRMMCRFYSCEAQKTGQPVSEDFFLAQERLVKTLKNARSWCKRHNVEFPADYAKYI